MTEYTVDKDGKVTSKGNGKKPVTTRYMEGDIPLTIPNIIKNIKKTFTPKKDVKDKKFEKKFEKKVDEKKKRNVESQVINVAGGGLVDATAKLKAKGMKDGGMVVKEKVVSIDTSPNSGLITQRGFGASRRT